VWGLGVPGGVGSSPTTRFLGFRCGEVSSLPKSREIRGKVGAVKAMDAAWRGGSPPAAGGGSRREQRGIYRGGRRRQANVWVTAQSDDYEGVNSFPTHLASNRTTCWLAWGIVPCTQRMRMLMGRSKVWPNNIYCSFLLFPFSL
jgi:hypothetical protein